MSSFLGGATWGELGSPQLTATSERVMPDFHAWNATGRRVQAPWEDGMLWPSSRWVGSDAGGYGLFGQDAADFGRWAANAGGAFEETGGQQCRKLVGTSRDASGAPLGSCVVRGYVTATNALAGTVTSDSSGYFALCTYSTGAHYLVAYKAGSPDVAGSSVNTLIPT